MILAYIINGYYIYSNFLYCNFYDIQLSLRLKEDISEERVTLSHHNDITSFDGIEILCMLISFSILEFQNPFNLNIYLFI